MRRQLAASRRLRRRDSPKPLQREESSYPRGPGNLGKQKPDDDGPSPCCALLASMLRSDGVERPAASARFFVHLLLTTRCANYAQVGPEAERNMIDHGQDGSVEFSDLYMRLLRAALDETNWSPSPRMRDRYLAAHVVRGLSMTCIVHESLQSRMVFNQGPGNGETPLL